MTFVVIGLLIPLLVLSLSLPSFSASSQASPKTAATALISLLWTAGVSDPSHIYLFSYISIYSSVLDSLSGSDPSEQSLGAGNFLLKRKGIPFSSISVPSHGCLRSRYKN